MRSTAARLRPLETCLFSSLFLLLRTLRNEVVGRSGRGRTNQISRPPGPTSPLRPKTAERMPGGKAEGRRQKTESRRQKAEGREQKAESRRQKAEGKRAEGREQKAEDRRQKAEGREQKAA